MYNLRNSYTKQRKNKMPLNLEFKPKRNDIKVDSKEAKEFPDIIKEMPQLIHLVGTVSSIVDNDKNVILIKLQIKGISVADDESKNMLVSVISERLKDVDALFYLYCCRPAQALPGEAYFRHSRFRPIISKNAREISHIKDLVIPEEFCCPLSGGIMDRSVYDTRSPTGARYEDIFLKYWLDKSSPKLMPHTKLPFVKECLKVDYTLQTKINNFIQSAIKAFEREELSKILSKCGLQYSEEKIILNQALLKLAEFHSNVITFADDLIILLRFGVDVNSQAPTKGHTALHLILRNKQINYAYAKQLLYSGAQINIEDADRITVFDIIGKLSSREIKGQLMFDCNYFKLVISCGDGLVLNSQRTSGLKRQQGSDEKGSGTVVSFAHSQHFSSPVTTAGDAHASLLQKIDVLLSKDIKRVELAAFEKPIKERSYAHWTLAIRFKNKHPKMPSTCAVRSPLDRYLNELNELINASQYAVAPHFSRSFNGFYAAIRL